MKKLSNFKLLFKYFKKDKLKLFLYVFLVLCTYMPALISAYFWGKALEDLISKNISGFVLYLGIWIGIYIICFTFVQYYKVLLFHRSQENHI